MSNFFLDARLGDARWISLFLILALMVGFSACKTGKKAGKGDTKNITANYLANQLLSNQLNAEWFSAKAKINFEDKNLAISGSASIIMRKDSILWLSIKKLGFEVARVQLTPDSIYSLNRLQSEYDVTSLDYIEQKYNIPADFQSIQSMLLGNPMLLTKMLKIKDSDGELFHLAGETKTLSSDYFILPETFKLQKMAFAMDGNTRKLQVNYDGFATAGSKQIFPYICMLDMNSPETGPVAIEIKYSKVEVNIPKSIKFEIPDNYTRADI